MLWELDYPIWKKNNLKTQWQLNAGFIFAGSCSRRAFWVEMQNERLILDLLSTALLSQQLKPGSGAHTGCIPTLCRHSVHAPQVNWFAKTFPWSHCLMTLGSPYSHPISKHFSPVKARCCLSLHLNMGFFRMCSSCHHCPLLILYPEIRKCSYSAVLFNHRSRLPLLTNLPANFICSKYNRKNIFFQKKNK